MQQLKNVWAIVMDLKKNYSLLKLAQKILASDCFVCYNCTDGEKNCVVHVIVLKPLIHSVQHTRSTIPVCKCVQSK